MNDYKIKKANEIYTKLQGAYWTREKCEEYGQYGQCENIRKLVSKWHKELEGLELTQEEKQMVVGMNNHVSLTQFKIVLSYMVLVLTASTKL